MLRRLLKIEGLIELYVIYEDDIMSMLLFILNKSKQNHNSPTYGIKHIK